MKKIRKYYIEIILVTLFLIVIAVVFADVNFMSNPLFSICLSSCVCGTFFYKQYKNLKEELEYIKEKNKILVKTLKERKEKEKEEEKDTSLHTVGISCIGCKNFLSEYVRLASGIEITQKYCKLDCKCEDRIDE